MVRIQLSIDINCPLAQAHAFLMNLDNFPLWQNALVQVEATNGLQVGSNITLIAMAIGKQLTMHAAVTHNNLRDCFSVVVKQGPISFESTYRLRPTATGCTFEITSKMDPGAVFRLAEGVLQSITESRYESDLRSLKAILEGSTGPAMSAPPAPAP
jgi:hypothetical protein